MSCKKGYCPNGLAVCCKDCIREVTNFCETACEGAKQERCKNYHDEGKKKPKRKGGRKTFRWLLLILAIVLLLFGAALLQTWKAAAYIGEEDAPVNQIPGQQVEPGGLDHGIISRPS